MNNDLRTLTCKICGKHLTLHDMYNMQRNDVYTVCEKHLKWRTGLTPIINSYMAININNKINYKVMVKELCGKTYYKSLMNLYAPKDN